MKNKTHIASPKPKACSPQPVPRAETNDLRKWESAAAIILMVLSLGLHVQNLFHASALWRDEVNSVNAATVPHVADVFHSLPYESFPMCWLLALRAWMGLGFTNDLTIRVFGLLTGVGLLVAVWFAGRSVTRSVPLLAFALIGLNSVIVYWGDSIRAYGFGTMLIIFTFAAFWRLTQNSNRTPPLQHIVCATVLGLLSVHSIYYNSVLLFGIGVAAAVIGWRNAGCKRAALILGICAITAVSMSIYLPIVSQVKESWTVAVGGLGFGWYFKEFQEALENSGKVLPLIWILLFALALGWGMLSQKKKIVPNSAGRDRALFAVIALCIAVPGYFMFLKNTNFSTNVWYYLALMGFMAVAIEASLSSLFARESFRIWRIVLSVLIIGLSFPAAWKITQTRFTQIDLIANTIESNATPNDLIVITKWYYGISFDRYFQGTTPWTTLPVVKNHKLHDFNPVKEQMALPDQRDVVKPITEKMAQTLASGHRVWLVGGIQPVEEGKPPFIPPSAPQLPSGWYGGPYEMSWSMQLTHFIQTHALRAELFPLPETGPVNRLEKPPLILVEGWRAEHKTPEK